MKFLAVIIQLYVNANTRMHTFFTLVMCHRFYIKMKVKRTKTPSFQMEAKGTKFTSFQMEAKGTKSPSFKMEANGINSPSFQPRVLSPLHSK